MSSDIVVDLTERVLAVEHPAVGAREQRVGDVAQAALGGRARPGAGPGALDPLALQVGRDLAAVEVAVAGVLDADARARDERLADRGTRCAADRAPASAPRDAPCHQLAPVAVERRQDLQRLERRRGVDVGVRLKHAVAVIESSSHLPLVPQNLCYRGI